VQKERKKERKKDRLTMSKAGFSIADLQHGAKKLNTVEPPSEKAQAKSVVLNEEEVQALEELYQKHDGDLDLM
jgi:mannose/fructose/N-acetylgalactosamine-specific phosphotransferase system component IIB